VVNAELLAMFNFSGRRAESLRTFSGSRPVVTASRKPNLAVKKYSESLLFFDVID
jgi:hypothetical protein